MSFDASLIVGSGLAVCAFAMLIVLAHNFGWFEYVLNLLADLLTWWRTFSWISLVRTIGERLVEWADHADERKRNASPAVVLKFERLTGKR